MKMDDVDELSTAVGDTYLHANLYPPLNDKATRDLNHMTVNNAGGWSINNNMNQVSARIHSPHIHPPHIQPELLFCGNRRAGRTTSAPQTSVPDKRA